LFFVVLSLDDAEVIFGDRNRSLVSHLCFSVYADDRMKFCRDRVVPVSRGSAWKISLRWRVSRRYRPRMETGWQSFRDQIAKETQHEQMFIMRKRVAKSKRLVERNRDAGGRFP
jgi:hypothetical protein